jgi:hypothetical protein
MGLVHFRASMVSRGVKIIPVPAPLTIRGPASTPPRVIFGPRPRLTRVGSPRGSAPTGIFAILRCTEKITYVVLEDLIQLQSVLLTGEAKQSRIC